MSGNRRQTWLVHYAVPALLFLIVLVLVFSILSPRFLSVSNLTNIGNAVSVVGLLAIGATFVIASGGIDLSSAAVMALAATCTALFTKDYSASPLLAVLVACGVGGLCGGIVGLLVNLTKAPSFIVTLGMLSVARALAFLLSDATPVYGLPEDVVAFGQGLIAGIPGPLFFLAVGVLVAWIIFRFSRFGLAVLVSGDNETAAREMGINIALTRLRLYAIAGAYSGLAGFVLMARTNSGDPAAGQSYELTAITAVILGGANLFGGRASVIGTLLGIFCLGVLQNGLNILAVNTYLQVLFVGLVLIGSTFVSRFVAK